MPRRIAVFTQGSRGDLEPYIALSLALKARGHSVTLAAPDNFAADVSGAGLAFAPMGTDIRALLDSPEIRKAIRWNPVGLAKLWRETAVPMMEGALRALWEVGREADLLIHHPKVVGAADVAEVTGAKVICASPVPIVPTGDFPMLLMARSLGRVVNRATWVPLRLARGGFRSVLIRWRREVLGLTVPYRPRPGTDRWYGADLRLVAVSEHVLPRPRDWDARTLMCGYWRIPGGTNWVPPEGLAAFLANGAAPVYIGFGSMPVDDPEHATRVIAEAVQKAGLRAVVAAGWAGLGGDAGADIHVLEGAPHDWLFPRMAGVVHHGGAGTTAAGLIAGKPSLICPAGVDQPFWARRVQALGCGPKPLSLARLDTGALAGRLAELVGQERYGLAARRVAGLLAEEDGLAVAVEAIEGL